jgi:hypothetical protein
MTNSSVTVETPPLFAADLLALADDGAPLDDVATTSGDALQATIPSAQVELTHDSNRLQPMIFIRTPRVDDVPIPSTS